MSDGDLIYTAPKPQPTVRRVYVLPRALVKRVHQFGFDSGHPSEVSAVKALLEDALASYDMVRRARAAGVKVMEVE